MLPIEEYRQAIEFLASHKQNFDIHNEGNDYAKVVLSNIFKNARHSVRIAANTLRNVVVDSQEYQDALCSFLSRDNALLQIIVSNLPENVSEQSNNNLYRRLHLDPAYSQGRIHIRIAGRNLFRIGEKPANFCVADGIMYRLENDIEKRTALCNFGNAERALKLESIFDKGFNILGSDVDLNNLFR